VVTNPTPVNGVFTIGPDATSVVIDQQSFTGDIVNPNFLPLNAAAQLSGTNTAIAIRSPSFTGSVTNAGQINVSLFQVLSTPATQARQNVIGIAIGPSQNGGSGGTFAGSIINSGSILAFGQQVRDLNAAGFPIPGTQTLANFAFASGIGIRETVTGSIVNTGAGGFGNSIFGFDFRLLPLASQIRFQSVPGVIDVNAPVLGGIKNAGFISGSSIVAIHSTAAIPGGITNTGYIGSDITALVGAPWLGSWPRARSKAGSRIAARLRVPSQGWRMEACRARASRSM
jgi:hypothetical protein